MNIEKFIQEANEARHDFVKIVSQYSVTDNKKLRTESDTLLIMYDQMCIMIAQKEFIKPHFNQLPDKLKKAMFERHSHRELPDGSDEIIYKEEDVIELLQLVESGDYKK